MNVAFEISPLLTASGSFGDKSGVYRYMIGLLDAYIRYMVSVDKRAKVVLFSFNRDLMKFPLNPEVLKIIRNSPQVVIINRISVIQQKSLIETIRDTIIMDVPVVRTVLKAVNKILSITSINKEISDRIQFRKYCSFLAKQFKKNNVKIVYHSDTGFHPIKGYKHVVTVYDLTAVAMSHMHREDTIDLQKRKMRFARLYCDGIVCISRRTKKDLLHYSQEFIEKKITVCYPGLDKAFIRRIDNRDGSLERLNRVIAKKKVRLKPRKYLLYYGTFEPRKNLQYLVRAFCDLADEGKIPSDFKLIMTGGEGWGKVRKVILDYISENYESPEKSRVHVLNFMSDQHIIDFIQNSAGVVYPSLYEGFGLPVLESMALGAPVICSNTSSMPEVGGSAVLYINPHDFFDLKDKIEQLINDRYLARDLSHEAIIQAKKFRWQKSARSLYEFMQKL